MSGIGHISSMGCIGGDVDFPYLSAMRPEGLQDRGHQRLGGHFQGIGGLRQSRSRWRKGPLQNFTKTPAASCRVKFRDGASSVTEFGPKEDKKMFLAKDVKKEIKKIMEIFKIAVVSSHAGNTYVPGDDYNGARRV